MTCEAQRQSGCAGGGVATSGAPAPDWFKVNHLIVLVGGNPLPNYLAIKTLLAEGGKVYPLYTATSAAVAAQLLKVSTGSPLRNNKIAGMNSVDIVVATHAILKVARGGLVGLHYTGGTKRMAVHAYRAVTEAQCATPKLPLTYLDARGDMLYAHDAALTVCHAWRPDVAVPGLDTLLALHGRALNARDRPIEQPQLPPLVEALRIVHADREAQGAWGRLLYGPERRDNAPLWRSTIHLSRLRQELERVGVLAPNDNVLRPAALQPALGVKDPMKWLRGQWLESAVLAALRDANERYGLRLDTMLANVHVLLQANQAPDFELDVVALRGHAVYALSCKTGGDGADPSRTKLRLALAEARVRARQIGGDEARVGLVCCADEPADLEDELRSDFDVLNDGGNARLIVFGRDALEHLPDRLGQWIGAEGRA